MNQQHLEINALLKQICGSEGHITFEDEIEDENNIEQVMWAEDGTCSHKMKKGTTPTYEMKVMILEPVDEYIWITNSSGIMEYVLIDEKVKEKYNDLSKTNENDLKWLVDNTTFTAKDDLLEIIDEMANKYKLKFKEVTFNVDIGVPDNVIVYQAKGFNLDNLRLYLHEKYFGITYQFSIDLQRSNQLVLLDNYDRVYRDVYEKLDTLPKGTVIELVDYTVTKTNDNHDANTWKFNTLGKFGMPTSGNDEFIVKEISQYFNQHPFHMTPTMDKPNDYPERILIDPQTHMYKPKFYTAQVVLDNTKTWAESEDAYEEDTYRWGKYSYTGLIKYNIIGVPINPIGHTGIVGRGKLGKWGPNNAADPFVTRFVDNKLQFVAITRKDDGSLALPGGMVDYGEKVPAAAKREFTEEAGNVSSNNTQDYTKKLDKVFQDGKLVYRGYVNDRRNTDNAWMESECYWFHVPDDLDLPLEAGDDATKAQWLNVSDVLDGTIALYANHLDMIKSAVNDYAGLTDMLNREVRNGFTYYNEGKIRAIAHDAIYKTIASHGDAITPEVLGNINRRLDKIDDELDKEQKSNKRSKRMPANSMSGYFDDEVQIKKSSDHECMKELQLQESVDHERIQELQAQLAELQLEMKQHTDTTNRLFDTYPWMLDEVQRANNKTFRLKKQHDELEKEIEQVKGDTFKTQKEEDQRYTRYYNKNRAEMKNLLTRFDQEMDRIDVLDNGYRTNVNKRVDLPDTAYYIRISVHRYAHLKELLFSYKFVQKDIVKIVEELKAFKTDSIDFDKFRQDRLDRYMEFEDSIVKLERQCESLDKHIDEELEEFNERNSNQQVLKEEMMNQITNIPNRDNTVMLFKLINDQ